MSYVAWLADFLRGRGVAPADLLAGTGIDEQHLADPAAAIDDAQHVALLRNARACCALPELGLEIGIHRHVSTLDRFGFALMCCETFGEALGVGCEFQGAVGRFTGRQLRIDSFTDGDCAVIRIEAVPELGDLRVFAIEDVLGNILTTTRWVTGRDLPVRELRCAYAAPAHAGAYRRCFDSPVRFGAAHTEVRFDASFLATRLPLASRNAATMYREHCRTLVAEVAPDALVERIRARILAACGCPEPLDECATGLGLSARTLRRRLRARGVSYQLIVDRTRAEIARRELRGTRRSIEELAGELGFSEATSFARAFKRWTGMSPRAFRDAHGGLPAG